MTDEQSVDLTPDEVKNKFYADREDTGERASQGDTDRVRVVEEVFARNDFDRILDTRCGDGSYTLELAEACGATDLYGFELYDNKLERANENGVHATRLDLNNARFPFEDDFFDAVCAVDIIEHLFDPDHFLEEVRRTLRPGGTFVVATPNLASIHNRLALVLGYQPFTTNQSRRYPIGHLFENHGLVSDETPPSSHHFRPYTLGSLRELLALYGFDVDEVVGASAVLPEGMTLYPVFERLERAVSRFPSLSYEVVLTATPGGSV